MDGSKRMIGHASFLPASLILFSLIASACVAWRTQAAEQVSPEPVPLLAPVKNGAQTDSDPLKADHTTSGTGTTPAFLSSRGLPDSLIGFAPARGKIVNDPVDGRIIVIVASETGPASLTWTSLKGYGTGSLRAESIVYFQDSREIFCRGDVLLIENGAYFSCQTLYMDLANKRGLASDVVMSGNYKLLKTLKPINTPAVTVLKSNVSDSRAPTLIHSDTRPLESQAILRAGEIIRKSNTLALIRNLRLTTSTLESPDFELRLKRVEYRMKTSPDGKVEDELGKISASHITVRLWGIPVVYFPWIAYDLGTPEMYFYAQYIQSDLWGATLLTKAGWRRHVSDAVSQCAIASLSRFYVSADMREKRGFGAGLDMYYTLPRFSGTGRIRGYLTAENQVSPSDDLSRSQEDTDRLNLINDQGLPVARVSGNPFVLNDEYLLAVARRVRDTVLLPAAGVELHEDTVRGWAAWRQRMTLAGKPDSAHMNWTVLDASAAWSSDRDVVREYSEPDYYSGRISEKIGLVRHFRENTVMSVLASDNVIDALTSAPRDPFSDRTVSYMPQVSLELFPTVLRWGLTAEMLAGAGNVGWKYYDYIPSANREERRSRAFGSARLSRPVHFGPFTLTPYGGGKGVIYREPSGGTLQQDAAVWGMVGSMRVYGRFPDLRWDMFRLHGLKHIIDFRVEYDAIGTPRHNPVTLPGFDSCDDIIRRESIRYILDQRFIAGGGAPQDWLGLRLWTVQYPRPEDRDRLLYGRAFDSINGYIYWNPHARFHIDSTVALDPEYFRVERISWGSSWLAPGGVRVNLYHRYEQSDPKRNREGFSQMVGSLQLPLTPHWTSKFDAVYDFFDTDKTRQGFNSFRVTLTRIFDGVAFSCYVEGVPGRRDVLGMVDLRMTTGMRNLKILSNVSPIPSGVLAGIDPDAARHTGVAEQSVKTPAVDPPNADESGTAR